MTRCRRGSGRLRRRRLQRSFRALDPRVVALALDAALHAIIFSVAEDTDETSLEQKVTDIEELFFRGILHDAWNRAASAGAASDRGRS